MVVFREIKLLPLIISINIYIKSTFTSKEVAILCHAENVNLLVVW